MPIYIFFLERWEAGGAVGVESLMHFFVKIFFKVFKLLLFFKLLRFLLKWPILGQTA